MGLEPSPSLEDAKAVLQTISLENLISGFPAWRRVVSAITRHPFRFASNIELEGATVLRPALAYALYSFLVAFLLTAPVFVAHHTKPNKILFPIRMCCNATILGILFHYSLRLLGAKRTLSGTMASYLYSGSTVMMLYLAISLPWLIGVGPDAIFGGWDQAQKLAAQTLGSVSMRWYLFASELFLMAMFYPFLRWFEITHHVRKKRIFVALMLSGLVGAGLELFLLAPFFGLVDKALGGILELLS
jgi:hypothetical protein